MLKDGIANALPTTTTLTVNGTGTFDLGGFAQTVAGLADGGVSTGTVTDSGAAATFTVNDAGGNTFSGTITNGANALALTKTGAGTLSLSAANAYTGATTVSAGTLTDGVANALPAGTTLTVNGTGTFDLGGFAQTVGGLADGGVNTGTVTDSGATATLTVNDAAANSFSGLLSGALALTKTAAGTLTLSDANTYTGATTISAGALLVNGSLASGSAVSVTSGATLGGGTPITSGTVSGSLSATGIISPGQSYGSTGTGILNTGNVAFNSGSSLDVDLNGTTAGSGYDELNVTGSVTIVSSGSIPTLNVSVANGFIPAVGNSFTIINNDAADTVSGTFSGLAEGAYFLASTGQVFQISYTGGTGNDVVITRAQAPVTGVITANNKMYDGTTTATLTSQTVTGVLVGDVGNVSLTVTAADFSTQNVGTSITVTATGLGLSGTAAGNYALTATTATTTANITPAGLTITANDVSKTYGETVTFAGTEFTDSGLVNSDTVTSVTLTSAGAAATATVAGSPYAIVPARRWAPGWATTPSATSTAASPSTRRR